MLSLSIVIVNYNARNYLEQCLRSIYSNNPRAIFEIVLVDNGSTDDSVSIVRKKFPEVKLIENHRNKGFVKAANKGLKSCKGKHILSLNSDTIVLSNALEKMIEFMSHHPECGACGPKVLNRDGTIQHQCKRGFPTIWSVFSYFLGLHRIFPENKIFGHYLMTYLNPDETNEVDSLSGACIMIRREVIKQVGLLDENFIMYGDDLDWCYRIKKAGWKIYYVPHAHIIHFGGKSSEKLPYKGILWFYRAGVIFYKKHHANNHNPVVNYAVYTALYLKALLTMGINVLRKEKAVGSKKP